MMRNQTILVVTPTLGESPYLDATIDSVARQRVHTVLVIAAPEEKHAALRRRFPWAEVVADRGKGGGVYGAINAALAAAPGGWDWFTYINDDDVLLPALSEMLLHRGRSDADAAVLYGDVEMVDESNRRIARITTERSPGWIPPLLQEGISPLMQQGMLIRRSTVERLAEFDTRYRLCADLDFWLRAYVGGARFRHYARRVAQFRLRAGQLSGATAVTECEQADIVRRHLPQLQPRWRRGLARLRYRALNLPRYLARARTRGFRRSYQLLQEEAVRQ